MIIKTHPSVSDMIKCIKPVLVFWIAQVTTDVLFLFCLLSPLSLCLSPFSCLPYPRNISSSCTAEPLKTHTNIQAIKSTLTHTHAHAHAQADGTLHALHLVAALNPSFTQLLMMPLVPGKIHVGPIAPSGHRPQYKANGVATYFLTIILFFGGAYLGFYNAGIFADIAAPMYALLAYFSTVFCFVLYLKGLYAPSTADRLFPAALPTPVFPSHPPSFASNSDQYKYQC